MRIRSTFSVLLLWLLAEAVAILLLASGCDANKDDNRTPLDSLMFHSSVYTDSPVLLKHGVYQVPAAPGSASMVVVQLTDKQAFTTMDGNAIGVAVLVTSTGGTGTYYELALLSKSPQGWVNDDTVLLGDREEVKTVDFDGQRVEVVMATHAPKDPMCCPTLEVTKRFVVENGKLVPVNDQGTPADPLSGAQWQWVHTLYNNDKKLVPSKPENYTIQFQEGGLVAVKADCNVKGGQFTADGSQLSITITHSTMAACEPGSLENEFVRNLEASAIFFFREGELYIDLMYDTGTMRFSRQP